MTRLTRDGLVTIPPKVRHRLGLNPGDEVVFEETDSGVVIRRRVECDRFEQWRGVADTIETVEERIAKVRGRI